MRCYVCMHLSISTAPLKIFSDAPRGSLGYTVDTNLSKLYCAISVMNLLSLTTCTIRPRASPAAQRRIGFRLPRAPYNNQPTRNHKSGYVHGNLGSKIIKMIKISLSLPLNKPDGYDHVYNYL